MKVNRGYIGYVRVSTVRQGEHGASLPAQREAITAYARRHGLWIQEWLEERQTAAKQGRPVFNELLRRLKAKEAVGIIVHKIDRGARNLEDWNKLISLPDLGIDLRFANSDVDLQSRGGRLSANIQAVVAVDYIQNLREEALKGIQARLNQGIWCFRAPLGYLDQGAGKPKVLDPVMAPLVRRVFELYDAGEHSLDALLPVMEALGLRNVAGGRVTRSGLATILRNPFYVGILRIQKRGESYKGAHQPLVSVGLFERVQARMDGRLSARTRKHSYLFRRLIKCQTCGRSLIGSRHKGNVYYRCQTKTCPTTSLREDAIERQFLDLLEEIRMGEGQRDVLEKCLAERREIWEQELRGMTASLNLRRERVAARMAALTDALIDGVIEKEDFTHRKAALLQEEARMNEPKPIQEFSMIENRTRKVLELAQVAPDLYKRAMCGERREVVCVLTSNRHAHGKNVVFTLAPPFRALQESTDKQACGHSWTTYRTSQEFLDRIIEAVKKMTEQEWIEIQEVYDSLYPSKEKVST